MPTVVGETMPLRFGCDWSSAAVLSNEVWSSSSPYTTSTSLMFGWFAASSFFITSIQAFWLVALAVAERIAISPASPIWSAIMSTWTLPMPSELAGWTNRSRHDGSVSASKVTTLVPASLAWLSESHSAFGSLAESTMAEVCFCASVSMYWAWASGLPSWGPTWEYFPPNSVTAFLPPASLMSK